jgi:hypothetical protein
LFSQLPAPLPPRRAFRSTNLPSIFLFRTTAAAAAATCDASYRGAPVVDSSFIIVGPRVLSAGVGTRAPNRKQSLFVKSKPGRHTAALNPPTYDATRLLFHRALINISRANY